MSLTGALANGQFTGSFRLLLKGGSIYGTVPPCPSRSPDGGIHFRGTAKFYQGRAGYRGITSGELEVATTTRWTGRTAFCQSRAPPPTRSRRAAPARSCPFARTPRRAARASGGARASAAPRPPAPGVLVHEVQRLVGIGLEVVQLVLGRGRARRDRGRPRTSSASSRTQRIRFGWPGHVLERGARLVVVVGEEHGVAHGSSLAPQQRAEVVAVEAPRVRRGRRPGRAAWARGPRATPARRSRAARGTAPGSRPRAARGSTPRRR